MFAISIIDRRPRISIYGSYLEASTQLKNFEWQYVTVRFFQKFLDVNIFIDGIFQTFSTILDPHYGISENPKTMIGGMTNGLMDQVSIAFYPKTDSVVLDEATLVVYYTFDGDGAQNDSLFNDESANSIRATGAHVTRLVGTRHVDQATLSLYDSALSWFQSSGFVLLYTHNYTYSYALWLFVSNVSSSIPLIHLVAKDEASRGGNNESVCLAMLVVNSTDPSKILVCEYMKRNRLNFRQ